MGLPLIPQLVPRRSNSESRTVPSSLNLLSSTSGVSVYTFSQGATEMQPSAGGSQAVDTNHPSKSSPILPPSVSLLTCSSNPRMRIHIYEDAQSPKTSGSSLIRNGRHSGFRSGHKSSASATLSSISSGRFALQTLANRNQSRSVPLRQPKAVKRKSPQTLKSANKVHVVSLDWAMPNINHISYLSQYVWMNSGEW